MLKPVRFRCSQSGLSLIEVLISLAALSLVALGIASFSTQMTKVLGHTSSSAQLAIFRDNLITLVKTNSSWVRTTTKNSGMSCLRTGNPCTSGGGQPISNQAFAIYDGSSSDHPFYDATNPASGITALGVPCTGFNGLGQNPNPECKYRFELKWTALCTTNCVNPQVSVSAELQYSGSANSLFNSNKFSVPPIIRSAQ